MAKKGGMPVYKTIDDYISQQSDQAKILLQSLRDIIRKTVPETVEKADSKVPTFTLIPGTKPEIQIMIAAYARYVSFYPFETTVAHFEQELGDFELGKGTVKFFYNKALPETLIKKMILYRKKEIQELNR